MAAWQTDKSPACAAAAEAMHAVTCTYAKQPKGTILIAAPDSAAVRAVIAYLSAFLTDQQHLARLPSKVNGDEVTVSGLRILVLPVSTSRRPRGILAKIDMADGVTVMPTELPPDKEMARIVAHALMVSAQTGKEMDKALEIARWLDPNADQEWIQRNFDSKSGVETVQQQKERRSDAGFYYMLDPPQPTTSVSSVSRLRRAWREDD